MNIPIIKEPILYVDVDDTLVSWDYFGSLTPPEDALEFIDTSDGKPIYLQVIKPTIESMKAHALRGHSIVVWSAGGAEWAAEVVKCLGLESIVDACLAKPDWILDDTPASEFIPESIRRDLREVPEQLSLFGGGLP